VFPGAWLMADSGGMTGAGDGRAERPGQVCQWDVVLSFADAQRDYVGQVAEWLKD